MSTDVTQIAVGRWRGILPLLGVRTAYLNGKNGPCPKCGGKDRFMFDDKDGKGTWICRQKCGAGDGFKLLELVNGWDFKTTADEVRKVVGDAPYQKPKPPMSDAEVRKRLVNLWQASRPIQDGDRVDTYLRSRGLKGPWSPALKTCDQGMVALVTDEAGKGLTLHRTFLTADGKKAQGTARKLMPGTIKGTAVVRLGPIAERLGVAEGIETALAASQMFGLPVWSTINTTLMTRFHPPEGVKEVVIFGDHDLKYGGHAAAWTLAHGLACDGFGVEVRIPDQVGTDWNDGLTMAEYHKR